MMGVARFIGSVVVEQAGPWWVLRDGFAYEETNPPLRIDVPLGFVTDFASIPRLLWGFIPPTDAQYSAASIVHDRLYETHALPRSEADAVFLRAMGAGGTPGWKRRLMWLAVRAFGGPAYDTGPMRGSFRRAIAERALRKREDHRDSANRNPA